MVNSKFIPNKTQINFGYNWDISKDTFVPLPGPDEDTIWLLNYLDWLEYWFGEDYLKFIPCSIGHC